MGRLYWHCVALLYAIVAVAMRFAPSSTYTEFVSRALIVVAACIACWQVARKEEGLSQSAESTQRIISFLVMIVVVALAIIRRIL